SFREDFKRDARSSPCRDARWRQGRALPDRQDARPANRLLRPLRYVTVLALAGASAMHALFAAIVAGACLIPLAAHADSIVLSGHSSQPPKAWLDGTTPRGFVVDAAALALTRAGYTVEIRLVPFERAMET